jgi:integrase/recombinase XerD
VFLERFAKYLKRNYNGDTPYNYFKKLKRVIKIAVKEKLLKENPATDIACPKNKGIEKDVLSIEELSLLVNAKCPNNYVRNAFLFCCLTGLRYCDVKKLKWKDIKRDRLKIVQEKTKQPVDVILNDDAKYFLGKPGSPNDLIYILPSHNGCLKNLDKWIEKAGVEKHITWHCARHTFATNLIQNGNDILITSNLLGHTSTKYTTRYTRINEQLRKDAIIKMPSIVNNSTTKQ